MVSPKVVPLKVAAESRVAFGATVCNVDIGNLRGKERQFPCKTKRHMNYWENTREIGNLLW